MSPIRAAGARLWYLPPYSPDLNPMEQTFAKIKHWMRMAQKRTINDTCAKSATSLLLLSPANAATTSRTLDTLLSKYEPLLSAVRCCYDLGKRRNGTVASCPDGR